MSLSVRAHLEKLILGTAGSTRLMTQGQFHLTAPDGELEDNPANAAERAFDIRIGNPVPLDGYNGYDGTVMYTQSVMVRVSYLVTNAGGDQPEIQSEQSGSGEVNSVQDRANTDVHQINNVIQWSENYSGTDPAIVYINPDGPASGPLNRGGVAILEIPYVMCTRATVPGSY